MRTATNYLIVALLLTPSSIASSLSPIDASQQTVTAIVKRCLARDYTVIDGVQRISWVGPDAEDFHAITDLGPKAIAPLATLLEDSNDFNQLLAVKFLIAIGGQDVYAHLVHATDSSKWVEVRLSAIDGIARLPVQDKKSRLEALQSDHDQLVSKRARDVLELLDRENHQ